ELEHRRAAETIADGGDTRRVHELVVLQRIEPGIDAGTKQCAVAFVLAGLRARLAGVFWTDALAVNIRAKRDVAELRELFRTMFLVIREAHPLMHDQHAGAFAGE